MKKLLWVLILGLVLSGCGSQTPVRTEPEETEAPAETRQQTVYDDSLLEESVLQTEYQSWWLAEEPAWDIDYRLPQILDDSPDALAFNREMLGFRENVEQKKSIYYDTIRWESHWNGSLLSLVVRLRDVYQGRWDYLICNYDFGSGKRLTDPELLDRLGWTQEEAHRALVRAAADRFDRDAQAWDSTPEVEFDTLLLARSMTISETNLRESSISRYAGDRGQLHAIATIGDPLTGQGIRQDLTLVRKSQQSAVRQVTLDNITARLQDDQVTLTFSEGPGMYLIPGRIETGRAYAVKGLFGSCTDLALGYVGSDGKVCLGLLDEEGRVTICDLGQGVQLEGDFCAMGPVPGLPRIIGFENSFYVDGWDFSMVSEIGERYSFYEALWHLNESAFSLMGDSIWSSADNVTQLSFHREPDERSGFRQLVWGRGGGLVAGGHCFYNGMTEEGLRLIATFYTEEGHYEDVLLTRSWQLQWEGESPRSVVIAEPFGGEGSLGIGSSLELYEAGQSRGTD